MSSSDLSDRANCSRAAAASETAKHRLVGKYRTRIRDYIARHLPQSLHRRVDPSDLAQETIHAAVQRSAQCSENGGPEFRQVVFRLAKDRLAEARRKHLLTEKRTIASEVGPSELFKQASDEPTPHETLMREELIRIVRDEIAKLSDKLREVLVAFDLEGKTYEEISGEFDIPLNTVRSRLHRARSALQAKLSETANDSSGIKRGPSR